MRIGELSKRTGFTRDAIRFYERQGLITPRSDREETNNYKSYGDDAVMTLGVVRDAQAAGLSIADVTVLLTQYLSEDAEGFDGDEFLVRKIAEVQDRIESSLRLLDILVTTRQALALAPYDDDDLQDFP